MELIKVNPLFLHSLSLSIHHTPSLLTTTTHPRIWVGWVNSEASKGPDRGKTFPKPPYSIPNPSPLVSMHFHPKITQKIPFLVMLQCNPRFACVGWPGGYPLPPP